MNHVFGVFVKKKCASAFKVKLKTFVCSRALQRGRDALQSLGRLFNSERGKQEVFRDRRPGWNSIKLLGLGGARDTRPEESKDKISSDCYKHRIIPFFLRDFGMESRVVVCIGILLLIADGKTWATAKKQFDSSANETLNQTWPDGEVAGLQPRARASYQLRIYQLQRQAAEKEAQQPREDPQRPENTGGPSEQRGLEEPVHGLIPIQGPDLNPPLESGTKVHFKKHNVIDLCHFASG